MWAIFFFFNLCVYVLLFLLGGENFGVQRAPHDVRAVPVQECLRFISILERLTLH